MASAASAGPPGGPPPPPGSLIPEGGAEYYIVRLTAYGNAALRELCRTPEQREVWSWPSYEFLVKMKKDRTLVISADQIRSARPSYVNGLLIASRGVRFPGICHRSRQGYLFGKSIVRLPGTWEGCCANCKWKEQTAQCNVRNSNEPRYIPQASAPLPPPSRVEELTDSDEANDDNGASGDGGGAGASGTATAVEQRYTEALSTVEHTVEAGQVDDANLWLRRTQWPTYLRGILVPPLLQSLETPAPEGVENEAIVRVIWDVIGSVAAISQRITKQCGHFTRTEAARTEQHESPFTPLLAYIDEANIQRYVEPCTSLHPVSLAEVPPGESSTTARSQGSPSHPDSQSYDTFSVSPIQIACMDFCIELLNQRIGVSEYESAFVCALAVLGRTSYGWMDTDSYPPILSKILKIARFIVLHKAVRLDPYVDELIASFRGHSSKLVLSAETPFDEPGYLLSGYDNLSRTISPQTPSLYGESDSEVEQDQAAPLQFTQEQHQRPQRFTQWLHLMVTRFMVRGSQTPIQWLLDLRSYGLKVHFNSSQPGFITWTGEDRILYKDLHFTMRDFRAFIYGLTHALQQILYEELLPSRAPELLSVRHRNTETAHRNIFIEDRLVVIATSYHKGFYTRNDTKLIYRYLPREVGELLVRYLWLVLPFLKRLQVLTLEQTPTRTAEAYIWAPDPSTGRVWSSGRFREALRNESAIGLYGHTLNISSYRDIAIGISRRFLRIASAFPQNSYEEGDTEKEIEDGDNIDLEGSTGFNSVLGHIADL
ncbi:hypothetical protein N7472_001563 [Penicillium cf. griseofulvum]|uniref:Uncharacterized protein n=1 Tax=Penicillium cf. griseofulvum TaxID=2972120 RepID=A0A9W9T154_9EURO|nr:hypothetical protein N7472_001563 [Penicillium cf. griseofulvum]